MQFIFKISPTHELFSKKFDYPVHLGVTEAGPTKSGTIKSSVGIGALLSKGIGDTIRVSLTDDPVEEVRVGFEILKSLGLASKGVTIVACPTCGRLEVDLFKIAGEMEEKLQNVKTPMTVALMGCAVNGPGKVPEIYWEILKNSLVIAQKCRCCYRSWTKVGCMQGGEGLAVRPGKTHRPPTLGSVSARTRLSTASLISGRTPYITELA